MGHYYDIRRWKSQSVDLVSFVFHVKGIQQRFIFLILINILPLLFFSHVCGPAGCSFTCTVKMLLTFSQFGFHLSLNQYISLDQHDVIREAR